MVAARCTVQRNKAWYSQTGCNLQTYGGMDRQTGRLTDKERDRLTCKLAGRQFLLLVLISTCFFSRDDGQTHSCLLRAV